MYDKNSSFMFNKITNKSNKNSKFYLVTSLLDRSKTKIKYFELLDTNKLNYFYKKTNEIFH